MTDVRSKNLYDLLGNDPELDPDRPPAPPLEVADKPVIRHGKRDGTTEPRASKPENARAPRGGRGGRFGGSEGAFRDRNAGAQHNRGKPVGEHPRDIPTGVVKNRDDRGNLLRDDRHSRQDRTVTNKQVDQGWGANSGESALQDEKIGEAIAQSDEKDAVAAAGDEAEAEPEDRSKSYAEYLIEQAENKRQELGIKEARKPNEGAKADKKWADAKEFKRAEEEDAYIKGREEKAKRERARKEKAYVDVDMRYVEAPRGGRGGESRGGRGGGRGGRGRGEGGFRGGRGDAPRGDGPRGGAAPRGDRAPRGGPAPRGNTAPRGGPAPRGDRAQAAGPTVDEKNFPALG
ncbi:hypothetical protein AJ80_04300 [Polytolypa hystricis UAMH7299]|uniref:Hyaluronan/mRNA-binding protein domain-containing protein n=1 Tax=Polytolypa hystricis (strain UAMH7299) TaxID=1447883 RepID=A0A2B7YDD4_POLH7|nr:hypothetical protein AJ80_04300 [Polytolypa hystricis UAMH7299]